MIKKIIFISLGILVVYLGILLVELQYSWIIKKDLTYFLKNETFIKPIPHAFFAIIIALLFVYITRKKNNFVCIEMLKSISFSNISRRASDNR